MVYSMKKRQAKNAKIVNYNFFLMFIFCFTCLLVLATISITGSKSHLSKFKLELVGDSNQLMSLNGEYVDDGIKITVNNKKIDINDVKYTVDNNINPSELGSYDVTYHVTYENKNYEVSRTIEVVDNINPELVVLTTEVSKNGCGNNLRYYAFDNYDGVLTDKVEVQEEDGKYKLSVSDSFGNETVVYVPISDDINDYVLELNGTLIQYVPVNTEYVDKGVKVTNICGKSLDVKYNTDGVVDTSVPGIYKVRYTIDGVDAFQERRVIVYEAKNNQNNPEFGEKKVYLTFDDGPGAYTAELLDILAKYNVKATFFVTAQFTKYLPLLEREHNEGHVVALHTKTHNWNLYRSFENYYKDFSEMNAIIEQYTGTKTRLFRFPGGGSNTISRGKSLGVMKYNISKMNELGYTYFDWNVDSEDAAGANEEKIYQNVVNGISNRNYSVVLMHDIKRPTINAIERIIMYCLENGYSFEVLNSDSPTVHHHVNN